jgi:hypothetical protein
MAKRTQCTSRHRWAFERVVGPPVAIVSVPGHMMDVRCRTRQYASKQQVRGKRNQAQTQAVRTPSSSSGSRRPWRTQTAHTRETRYPPCGPYIRAEYTLENSRSKGEHEAIPRHSLVAEPNTSPEQFKIVVERVIRLPRERASGISGVKGPRNSTGVQAGHGRMLSGQRAPRIASALAKERSNCKLMVQWRRAGSNNWPHGRERRTRSEGVHSTTIEQSGKCYGR